MSKVSICIPIYGVEKYIERCVRSLFEQTLDSIEYVFIDDCSPDNSIVIMYKVLAEYPQRKDQVKVIRHEVNQGVGAARNHGVAACTGDYVIHCDPDDWVDLDFYEKLYNRAIASNADVVCAPFITEFADLPKGKETFPRETQSVEDYISLNTGQHLNSLWSKLFKREIALDSTLNCPDSICMGEDLLRNIQMLHNCKRIAFIQNSFYHYWQNSISLTHNFTEKQFENIKEIIAILDNRYQSKYTRICFNLKANMFLGALLFQHKNNHLRALFSENWKQISLPGRIRIIQASTGSSKGKIALSAACISHSLTFFILRLIFNRKSSQI